MITQIYTQHLKILNNIWDERISKSIQKRVSQAMNSLLPKEIIDGVKKCCIQIAVSKVSKKVEQWRSSHLQSIDLFAKDIESNTIRLLSNDETELSHTNFSILLKDPLPSVYFPNLRQVLHIASIYPEQLDQSGLLDAINQTHSILKCQTFTSNIDKSCGWVLVQLLQLIIANRCELLDDKVLQSLIRVWKLDKLKKFVTPPQKSCDEGMEPVTEDENARGKVDKTMENYIFAHFINIRYVLQLEISGNTGTSFVCLSDVVLNLLKEGFISMEILTEQLVGLFKHEWTKVRP